MSKVSTIPSDFKPPEPKGGWSWRTLNKSFLNVKKPGGKGVPKVGHALSDEHPNLSKEFFYEWNGNATPSDFRSASGVTVFWKCASGHIYPADIGRRANGALCPICQGQRPSKDRNLRRLYPEIANQWHKSLNGIWGPEDFLPQSDQKAVWICPDNPEHLWVASIKHRTASGSGCPLCSGGSSRAEMRLLTELAALFGSTSVHHRTKVHRREVDILLAIPGERRVCIEFDGSFYHRNKQAEDESKLRVLEQQGETVVRIRGFGLQCDRKLDVPVSLDEENSAEPELAFKLVERIAELLSSTSPLRDLIKTYLSERRVVNQAGFVEMTRTMNRPRAGESLLDRMPDIMRVWSPLNSRHPKDIAKSSNQYFEFVCDVCSHKWSTTANNFDGGCKKCAAKAASERMRKCLGKDSIMAKHPDLIHAQWDFEHNHNISPDETSLSSNQIAWWFCARCSKPFKQKIQQRVKSYLENKNSGCPTCAGVGIVRVFQNIKTGERIEKTLSEMASEYRLSVGNLSAVVSGKRNHASGWVYLGEKGREAPVLTVEKPLRLMGERYQFKNLESDKDFLGTQHEFRKFSALGQTAVSRICRKEYATAGNWVCLGKEGEAAREISSFKRSSIGDRHKFRNTSTGQIIVATLSEMSRDYNIAPQNLSHLKAGRIKSCGGWKYIGPEFTNGKKHD